MAKTEITCERCGRRCEKATGSVNRSRLAGLRLFCGRECAGIARRAGKPDEQRREEKRLYDIEYRARNRAILKAKKADYHKRSYDPAKAAEHRKKRMPRHVEYCRQPVYRAWKKSYDREYRAKKHYGPAWECFVLALEIREEALSQMTDYEIRLSKGTLNKVKQRRRDYDRAFSKEPQVGTLGNLERGARR